MNNEEVENLNLEFRVNESSVNLKRDAEIALRIIKGEKTKDLVAFYKVSDTTILNAYKKVCRTIWRALYESNLLHLIGNESLYRAQFKSVLGEMLAQKYKDFIEEKIKNNPGIKWLDKPEESIKLHKIISNKIQALVDKAERKRMAHIKMANKEFLSLKRQLMALLADISETEN